MDIFYTTIDFFNIPVISALVLGILISISPCLLTSNITALAFVSKDLANKKKVLASSLFYTLGRAFSYFTLATLIYFGFSTFKISSFFQTWGNRVLGPLLILIALFVFGLAGVNFNFGGKRIEKVKLFLTKKGYLGSFLLGLLLSLAFCPYSAALFFGIIIPLMFESSLGLFLALIFALGSGLPIILFSLLMTFSFTSLNKVFKAVESLEKFVRPVLGVIILLVGLYYLRYLFNY